MEAVQKGGYPHFMLKEIHEQPPVAARAAAPARARGRGAHRGAMRAPPPVPGRLRHQLPRLPGRGGLFCPACRASGHPRAGAAVHRPVRAHPRSRGCRALRQPVAARPRMCSTPSQAASARHDRVRAGQRDRLHPHQRQRGSTCRSLRLRDQRPRHQDLHQPGRRLPVPGLPPGWAATRRILAHPPRPDGADPQAVAAAGARPSPPKSTPGTTCTAWATAPPTRSRWKAR